MFTLRKGSLCPVCEKGRLQEERKTLPFVYKGRSKKFPNQKVYTCNVCDYEGLTRADNEQIEKSLADFRRIIDGLFPCDTLKSIRERLGLNKKSMAKLLSVNEKTVGRYENGKVTQSAQVDKLYRVLEAFPYIAAIIEPDTAAFRSGFHGLVVETEKDHYDPQPANGYRFQTNNLDQRLVANATGF
ncbi:type II toxin-antitoxin system MqsA family antitoxin [Patescibacteria group bacterium]|nr:type II toxin-antitoxin system MqsA family antitoxin [Pseudomonadota bacterium]MBU1932020.1 type II toxin-antitoxin system MqsA family antitoxin [Patescibacteria group bacterium]